MRNFNKNNKFNMFVTPHRQMSLFSLFLKNLHAKNPTLKDHMFGTHSSDEQIGYLSNNLIGRWSAHMSCGGPGEPTIDEAESWYKNWNFEGKLKQAICERNGFMEQNGHPENVIPMKLLYNLYGDSVFTYDCKSAKNSTCQ